MYFESNVGTTERRYYETTTASNPDVWYAVTEPEMYYVLCKCHVMIFRVILTSAGSENEWMVGQQKQTMHDDGGQEEAPTTMARTPLDAAIIPPRYQGYDDWRPVAGVRS